MTKKTFIIWLISIIILPATTKASTQISQEISLKAGWNAVFLTIQIQETDLNKIFKNTAIKKVVSFYPRHSSVQFIQDPDSIDWNKDCWLRWVSSDSPDAFLNNLFRLNGNHAYLIYVKKAFTWHIQGQPILETKKWQPESFNLTGFHIAPEAQITFADYFENSKAHIDFNIYKLIRNKWERVANPYKEFIQANSAYWIFCKGGSSYGGPLHVKLPGINNTLEYHLFTEALTIEVSNQSAQELSFSILPVENNQVPLSLKSKDQNYQSTYEPFQSYSSINPLQPGQTEKVCFAVRRKEIHASEVSGLLKISDDLGNQNYITVLAKGLQ
ncbi:MAG: hypothetical protein OMM_03467 [Candidatus Magnetoglobus multicellularis str. Araruama]|uniref:Uncharacterized protein n=1 Tax=Candidatus Magnetoglobus multicellularis str. Araruama TaxID=890399 RepID=A0A1V1P5M2_9BACT|nr:MAG: hypothetical protein OMM_03467 [Candidatus Magnetoglobus multicellularis str. Araruama]